MNLDYGVVLMEGLVDNKRLPGFYDDGVYHDYYFVLQLDSGEAHEVRIPATIVGDHSLIKPNSRVLVSARVGEDGALYALRVYTRIV